MASSQVKAARVAHPMGQEVRRDGAVHDLRDVRTRVGLGDDRVGVPQDLFDRSMVLIGKGLGEVLVEVGLQRQVDQQIGCARPALARQFGHRGIDPGGREQDAEVLVVGQPGLHLRR